MAEAGRVVPCDNTIRAWDMMSQPLFVNNKVCVLTEIVFLIPRVQAAKATDADYFTLDDHFETSAATKFSAAQEEERDRQKAIAGTVTTTTTTTTKQVL